MSRLLAPTTVRNVAFGAVMFSSSLINNVFVTYYVELYMNTQISPTWFYVAQTIFMIWNAVNDPLFGWLSDTINFQGLPLIRRRTLAVSLGGALWAAAFIVVWLPPESSPTLLGLHFLFSLCLYDGMLSYVEVNHSALLAEMSSRESERAQALMFSSLFAGLGSLSSYGARALWDPAALRSFRVFCVCLSLVAFLVFQVSAKFLTAGDKPAAGSAADEPTANTADPPKSYFEYVKQLFSRRNFSCFVLIAFSQQFDCTFEKAFISTTLDSVAASALSSHARGIIISLSFLLPHLLVVGLYPVISRWGVYHCVWTVLSARIVLLLTGWLSSLEAPLVLAGVLLLNRVASEGMCRLFPMVSSDLIDEDAYLHRRGRSMGASLIGTAFVLAKFAQSFAPMLGYRMLSSNTMPPLTLMLMLASACVCAQCIVWKQFTLKGAYLRTVKHGLSEDAV